MLVGADIPWRLSQKLSQPRAGNGDVLALAKLGPTLPIHSIGDPMFPFAGWFSSTVRRESCD